MLSDDIDPRFRPREPGVRDLRNRRHHGRNDWTFLPRVSAPRRSPAQQASEGEKTMNTDILPDALFWIGAVVAPGRLELEGQ